MKTFSIRWKNDSQTKNSFHEFSLLLTFNGTASTFNIFSNRFFPHSVKLNKVFAFESFACCYKVRCKKFFRFFFENCRSFFWKHIVQTTGEKIEFTFSETIELKLVIFLLTFCVTPIAFIWFRRRKYIRNWFSVHEKKIYSKKYSFQALTSSIFFPVLLKASKRASISAVNFWIHPTWSI